MGSEQESSGGLQGLIARFLSKIWRFLERAWNLGVSEPKKFVHCLRVGLALSLVSLFYYTRPLYDGVGGTVMCAVLTVVVVFEYTVVPRQKKRSTVAGGIPAKVIKKLLELISPLLVSYNSYNFYFNESGALALTICAKLYKSMNRATATFLAGSLGVGIHWVASQSGDKFEPIILGSSVFLLASVATFSRFIPTIKSRFDYGAVIFILTFSLVSISGYSVDELLTMAQNRVSTILLGTSICILTSVFFVLFGLAMSFTFSSSVIWKNLQIPWKGIMNTNNDDDSNKKRQGYKFVLNSKGTAESLANFARWEPAHGSFNFRHPSKQYLKIRAAMRHCCFSVDSLSSCINSEVQIPNSPKKNFNDVCMRLSSHCSPVLKELAATMKTMRKSSTPDLLVGEMNFAVQELQNALKSLPSQLLQIDAKGEPTTKQFSVPLMDILPLATETSLLIEIAARIEGIVDAVDELADLAEFEHEIDEQSKQSQSTSDKMMKPKVKSRA